MKFRTEIEIPAKQPINIEHDSGIVMLGSCFTDNIGEMLEKDGFDVVHNPMGTLYNPASLAQALSLAMNSGSRHLTIKQDTLGIWHCLDFATKYTHIDKDILIKKVNADLDLMANKIKTCATVIITLGTAYVFKLANDIIVGNCHKFPASEFTRVKLSVAEIEQYLHKIISLIPTDKNIIFTVSPIRHTADTLHGNQISKATLQLSIDGLLDHPRILYFPSYEIMLDDLRDYRFYADDLKHPSTMAVEYIYEIFCKYYMTDKTINKAMTCRKESKRAAHRPINPVVR